MEDSTPQTAQTPLTQGAILFFLVTSVLGFLVLDFLGFFYLFVWWFFVRFFGGFLFVCLVVWFFLSESIPISVRNSKIQYNSCTSLSECKNHTLHTPLINSQPANFQFTTKAQFCSSLKQTWGWKTVPARYTGNAPRQEDYTELSITV